MLKNKSHDVEKTEEHIQKQEKKPKRASRLDAVQGV